LIHLPFLVLTLGGIFFIVICSWSFETFPPRIFVSIAWVGQRKIPGGKNHERLPRKNDPRDEDP
jgi:hypothetical protein